MLNIECILHLQCDTQVAWSADSLCSGAVLRLAFGGQDQRVCRGPAACSPLSSLSFWMYPPLHASPVCTFCELRERCNCVNGSLCTWGMEAAARVLGVVSGSQYSECGLEGMEVPGGHGPLACELCCVAWGAARGRPKWSVYSVGPRTGAPVAQVSE